MGIVDTALQSKSVKISLLSAFSKEGLLTGAEFEQTLNPGYGLAKFAQLVSGINTFEAAL